MSKISVTYQNNSLEAKVLPEALGGYTIPADTTKIHIYNMNNARSVDRDVPNDIREELDNLDNKFVTVEGADSGVEAAGVQAYVLQSKKSLRAGSVRVLIPRDGGGTIEMLDDGAGALAETGGAGTGTIDYDTGEINVGTPLGGTPAAEGAILLDYMYQDLKITIADAAITDNDLNTSNKVANLS